MSAPKKVFVGMPVYSSWSDKFALSLLKVFHGAPCPLTLFSLSGDSLVCRARNNLAAEFLESPCDHLLFLDTDLEFNAEAVHRLLRHDLPVVGGVYFQKRHDVTIPVFNKLDGEEINGDGLMKVRHVGTGMMLIAREGFEAIAPNVPSYRTCDDEKKQRRQHEFFPVGVHDDTYESEDWGFCRLARQAGFDVWVDTRVSALHHGLGVYPCEPVEQLKRQVGTALVAAQAIKAGPARDELLAILSEKPTEASRR